MSNRISEIVKEYVLEVDDLDFAVKARITKSTTPDGQEEFHWDISHYCCPSQTAGVYSPSKRTDASFQVIEGLVEAYMNAFTTIGVTPNEFY